MIKQGGASRHVVYTIAIMTFIAGILILTPWYQPPTATGLLAGIIESFEILPASLLAIGASAPALVGLILKSYTWTRRGCLALFSFYVFTVSTRILIVGDPLNLLWWPSLIIAVVLLVVYIWDRRQPAWKP